MTIIRQLPQQQQPPQQRRRQRQQQQPRQQQQQLQLHQWMNMIFAKNQA